MKPCVLVAAPTSAARPMLSAIGDRFCVVAASEPRRAAVLAVMAAVQCIVVWDGFVAGIQPRPGVPVLTIAPGQRLGDLAERIAAAIPVRKRAERTRRARLAVLATVPYEDFLDLARFWTTRDYLIGLMRAHGGTVSEAARAAKLERESLHRLLRRHALDAEAFRPHAPDSPLANVAGGHT